MKEFFQKLPRFAPFLAGAFLLVILDFAVKWVVQNNCTPYLPYEVIPNFFYITLSYNTKIAFSIGFDNVFGRILNITISLVMSIGIPWYWIKHDKDYKPIIRVILMLMVGGAVGNLIDRSFYWSGIVGFDGVIDFAQFYLGGGPSAASSWVNPFATFNLADAYLVVGVFMLLVYEIVDIIKNGDHSLERDPRLDANKTETEIKNKDEQKDDNAQ